MTFQEVFGSAKWITRSESDFPVTRKVFTLPAGQTVRKATLYAVGLGFFRLYMNGVDVTNRAFLPLSTDYEARENYPEGEKVHGHRLYVPVFDVTNLLASGKNLLAMYFGGGWYSFWSRKDAGHSNAYYDPDLRYGDPKAVWRLTVETDAETLEFVSSEDDIAEDGAVWDYSFTTHECRDLRREDPAMLEDPDWDDSAWKKADAAKDLDTDYLFTDCPADAVIEKLDTVRNAAGVWDCGRNISGYPVLRIIAAAGEKIRVTFAEDVKPDGTLDMGRNHDQRFEIISDGTARTVSPEFTWFGFRYFTVEGAAEVLYTAVVHSNVAVSSDFDSDNDVLNYIYRTYLNTQLCNMHAGIPSDCPHIERRGYTGDGQLTAHAAMTVLDAQAFYRKWIDDISDCQDDLSGHIQYTAPYIRSGGGPGAWGCAIVEVPYQYYLHYGDPEPMFRLYPQMKRYFDYLEAHSENGLVTSDKAGEWCLGDWCAPYKVMLPAAFVNNYYYIRSLNRAAEIARLQGLEEDAVQFEATAAVRRDAVRAAYFNTWDGCFIGNAQGANAFALDMGLGNDWTKKLMLRNYDRLGEFDTGICGTEVLLRVLFEMGASDVAYKLLMSEKDHSFGGLMRRGATTFWEYWPESGGLGRSLNHPMFGSAAAFLFEYVLGIRRQAGTAGYRDLVIAPVFHKDLGRVSGRQKVPAGDVAVSYTVSDGKADVTVVLPEGVNAVFTAAGMNEKLHAGENRLSVTL